MLVNVDIITKACFNFWIMNKNLSSKRDFATAGHEADLIREAAVIQRQKGHFDSAFRNLEAGLRKYPDNARLWQEYGKQVSASRKDDGRALQAYIRAYKLAPTTAPIVMDVASFLTRVGHFDSAENLYVGIYKREGDQPRILSALGAHYQKRHEYTLAAACFGKACEMDEEDDYCANRLHEIEEYHRARYTPFGWQKFQDRIKALPPLHPAFAAPL